jgi:hypothetical protein
MTKVNIDGFSRREMNALKEITRKKLFYGEKTEIRLDILNRLANDLKQIYPDLSVVEIRNKIKRTYWEITSPNTNCDPNDNEEFRWYFRGDGTIHRILTELEQHEKDKREWKEKFSNGCREEDTLIYYCYQILRQKPWRDQSSNMIKVMKEVMKEGLDTDMCKQAINKEIERRTDDVYGSNYEEITNKKWQIVSARGSNKEDKTQADIDWKFRQNNPTNVLCHSVGKLLYMCECTENELRNGNIFKICKLTKMANVYILNLFRDAAERRSRLL